MTIIVSRTALYSRLQQLSRMVKPSKILPELESFKFSATQNNLKIIGADELGYLETSIECGIDVQEEKNFIIDAKVLLSALKELPEQILTIEVTDISATFNYEIGKFEISLGEVALFPNIKTGEVTSQLNIPTNVFEKGISTVSKFVAFDDLRPIFSCINIVQNSKLSFAATTGHMLSIKDFSCVSQDDIKSMNLPYKAANVIEHIIKSQKNETIDISMIDNNVIKIAMGEYTLLYRLAEGKYPNYRSIIPQSNYNVIVDRESLLSAIRRVVIFTNKESSLIVFKLKENKLFVEGEDQVVNKSAVEELTASYDEENIDVGFNAKLLASILETIEDDQIVIKITDSSKAVVFEPARNDGSLFLLMPMMINH